MSVENNPVASSIAIPGEVTVPADTLDSVTPDSVMPDKETAQKQEAILDKDTVQAAPIEKTGWKNKLSQVGRTAGTFGKKVGQTTQSLATATVHTATVVGSAVGSGALTGTKAVSGAVTNAAEASVDAVASSGRAVSQATVTAAGTAVGLVGTVTLNAGKAVADTTTNAVTVTGAAANNATAGLGMLLEKVEDSSQLRMVAKSLKLGFILDIIEKVDIAKAQKQVARLQKKYPAETPNQIAHRLMVKKAMLVGGSGMAMSLVPGLAAPLVAADIAASIMVQAEMGYQIAAAYGLDLTDPARKGEILAIFGVSFGSNYAIKSGLTLMMRNVPVAGSVVGAGTNIASLYCLGQMACLIHEGKVKPGDQNGMESAEQSGLSAVFEQQVVMDQILLHMFLAGDPARTWENTLPNLDQLSLSPASLAWVAGLSDLPPIDALLAAVNADFARSLLAQCQQMAEEDGTLTAEESELLAVITTATTQQLQG